MTLVEENPVDTSQTMATVDPSEMVDNFADAQALEPAEPVSSLTESGRSESPQLAALRADIARDLPEAQAIPVSVAERAARAESPSLIGREFAEGVQYTFAAARTIDELKNRAMVYVATNHELGESSMVGDEGFKGYLVETADGWYKALPGSARGELVLQELNKARQALEQRGAIATASARVAKAFDGIREYREVGREVRAERAEAKESQHQQTVRAEAKLEAQRRQAEAGGRELAARRRMEHGRTERTNAKVQQIQQRNELAVGSIEEIVARRRSEARQPYADKLDELEARHAQAILEAERRGILQPEQRYEIDLSYATKRNKLYAEGSKVAREAEAKARADYKQYQTVSTTQIEQLIDFEESNNPEPHVFKPDQDMDPQYAAEVAGANSEMVGKLLPPYQVDEYQLGDTVMQRMVFNTNDQRTLIIEDWDKTSGKLKRQSIIKGDRLLIPDYENEGLGRLRRANRKRPGKARYVLDDQVYADLGLIDKREVAVDSDTTYGNGYSSYVQNLVRSGAGTYDMAQDYASYRYKDKAKNSPGFIQLLTKGFLKRNKPKK